MTADATEEVVPSLLFRSGAHRDAPTSSSGAVGEWKACNGVSMTADATEEAVPSLSIRSGAHRDAPTSNPGAVALQPPPMIKTDSPRCIKRRETAANRGSRGDSESRRMPVRREAPTETEASASLPRVEADPPSSHSLPDAKAHSSTMKKHHRANGESRDQYFPRRVSAFFRYIGTRRHPVPKCPANRSADGKWEPWHSAPQPIPLEPALDHAACLPRCLHRGSAV